MKVDSNASGYRLELSEEELFVLWSFLEEYRSGEPKPVDDDTHGVLFQGLGDVLREDVFRGMPFEEEQLRIRSALKSIKKRGSRK